MTPLHQAIHGYTAAIQSLDADAFAACFTAQCELNDPVGAPTIHGHDGVKAFFLGIAGLLRKIEMTPVNIHIGGTRAAFSWKMVGEGKAGQPATADGIDVLEFDQAGKIIRSWGYWNPGPFVAALTA